MASEGYNPMQSRRGFTLVELLVVITIISIVSGLTLAGLGAARRRSKADATRSTIRKIDEIVMDQYDSYSSRMTGSGSAGLNAIRRIIVEEMPDSWSDVFTWTSGSCANCITGPGRSYAKYKQVSYNGNGKLEEYQSAECLYLVVTRSGYEPAALENFRPSEIGDIDKDGLKEFIDAWGNPIAFLRWAPGFSTDKFAPPNISSELGWTIAYPGSPPLPRQLSAIQIADPKTNHDELDASGSSAKDFQLFPLIYSAGPDESGNAGSATSGYGLLTLKTGWIPPKTTLASICLQVDSTNAWLVGAPDPENPTAYRDNVTNHDAPRR